MDVFTVSLSQWREATQRGILVINTTVKNGHPLFAPTWDMVMGHREGRLTDHEYQTAYVELLSERLRTHTVAWQEFMTMYADSRIALGCFCPTGKFCHRHILAPLLSQLAKRWNIPYAFYGELTRGPA